MTAEPRPLRDAIPASTRPFPRLVAALTGVLALVLGMGVPLPARAAADSPEEPPMVLTTGTIRGVYHPVGSALCTLFNIEQSTGWRCVSLRSRGSVANIARLKDNKAQIALVQSDTQTAAYEGTGEFGSTGAYPQLRSLFALYSEYMAVLVRADAGILQIDDLRGKRINIGRRESGQHAVVEQVLAAAGLSPEDFTVYREKGPGQADRLCTGELDAAVFIGGSPNGLVTEVTLACDIRLLPITGPKIERLIETHPQLSRGLIPGGRYRGNPEDVPTVSVTATVVTNASQPEDRIYDFVRTIFDNFEILAQMHPVLNEIEPREMARSHGTAPLHPGAERFFRERGLIGQFEP